MSRAQTDPDGTAQNLKEALVRSLCALSSISGADLVESRYARFRAYGEFSDAPAPREYAGTVV